MVYELHDLWGIHSSSMVHWFLEFLWFRGFLKDLVISSKIVIFVWFFPFYSFGYFLATNEWFMHCMILGDLTVIPQCIAFRVLVFPELIEGFRDFGEN